MRLARLPLAALLMTASGLLAASLAGAGALGQVAARDVIASGDLTFPRAGDRGW